MRNRNRHRNQQQQQQQLHSKQQQQRQNQKQIRIGKNQTRNTIIALEFESNCSGRGGSLIEAAIDTR